MALHWNMQKVHDHHGLHNTGPDAAPKGSDADKAGDVEWRKTETIIFATMAVGIPSITEKNVETFAKRIAMWQRVNGALMRRYTEDGVEDAPITYADIERRIGLGTNASALTDIQYGKKLVKIIEQDAATTTRNQKRELAEA